MDIIWTIALIVIGYYSYNWYSNLQQQVKAGAKPDDRVEGAAPSSAPQEPKPGNYTDYIDYEEVD